MKEGSVRRMANDVVRNFVTKEKLEKITDLNREKIGGLSDEQLQEFTETLDIAVSTFPIQKEKIETAFAKQDYAEVLKWVRAMRNRFAQIHADSLAKDCDKCLNQNENTENVKHNRLGSFLEYFLQTATLFYSDVQTMLEKLEFDEEEQEEVPEEKLTCGEIKAKLLKMDDISTEKISGLEGEQLENYVEMLGSFVEGIGTQLNGLRSTLIIKNYAQSIKWLTAAAEALAQIHADDLASEANEQVELYQDLGSIRAEKFEIFTNYFLGSMTMFVDDLKELNIAKVQIGKTANEQSEADATNKDAKLFSKNIIILYETRMFLETFRVALDGTGYNLIGAQSESEMIDFLDASKPDLILIDDDIVGVNGIELARKIKAKRHQAPVMLLTGNITKEHMVQAFSAGIVDFIVKPIATQAVREKITQHLS